ncbi:MAG: AMP-binding protein [Dehalococcoidia bacterium]
MAAETLVTPETIADYTSRGAWLKHPLIDEFLLRVEENPEKTAIIDRGQRLSYREVYRLVNRLAAGLLGIGLRPGDRVACQLPNWWENIVCFLAAHRMGLVFIPVLPLYRRREMEYILSFTEAAGIIVPSGFGGFDFPAMIEEIRPQLPGLRHLLVVGDPVTPGATSLSHMLAQGPGDGDHARELDRIKPDPNELSFIVFTSGTEAAPKGVMRSANMLWAIGYGHAQKKRMVSDDIVYPAVPLTHSFGIDDGLMAPLLVAGATVVLRDKFDPAGVAETIVQDRVTQVAAPPAVLKGLVDLPNVEKYDFPKGCVMASGGAACPAVVVRQLMALGLRVSAIYGASEGLAVETELDYPPEAIAETVGTPYPFATLKIVGEDGLQVKQGERGLISFRGPQTFSGYYHDEERTRAVVDAEGFVNAGDLGYVDGDGRLRIVGRKKEIIVRGGENISPQEIEDLLIPHPKLAEVAIVGMPDPRLGERSCAFVIPKAGETVELEDLVSFLRGSVATFKLPERLEITEHIPRTALGKIQRNQLTAQVTEKLKAEGLI